MKELKEIQRDTDPTIRLAPDGENLSKWTATLQGPLETPFETGTFAVSFTVPEAYPLAPPKAYFVTKIFHPNVHFNSGEICLDILKTAWSPAWTLHSVCRAILALLCNPEPDSPLNCDAGNMLRAGDDLGYWSMARMYTVEAAGGTCAEAPFYPPVKEDAEVDRWWWDKKMPSEGGKDAIPAPVPVPAPAGGDGGGVGGAGAGGVEGTARSVTGGGSGGGGGGGGNFAANDPTTAAGRAAASAQVDARAAAAAAAASRFHASRAASVAALKAAEEAAASAGK